MSISKILLVEDESIMAMSFEQSLKFLGYDIVGIASTGEDAFNKVIQLQPDLILMDIVLKGELDGIETASRIKEDYDIPIVFLTAHPEESIINRAKLTSPSGYLIKPVEDAELKNVIDLALYKHDIENKLKTNDDRLKVVLDSIDDIIFIKDRNLCYIEINSVLNKYFRVKREDIIGKTDDELFNPKDVEHIRLIDERVLNKETIKEETPPIGPYNTIFEIIKSPIHNNKGEVIGLCGICRDITERKKSEVALQDSKQLLSNIIEFLPDATFAIDYEGKIIAWNYAIEEMTGIPQADIIGKGDYAYSIPFYGEPRPTLIDLVSLKDSKFSLNYNFIQVEDNNLCAEVFVPQLYNGKGAYLWIKASALFDSNGKQYGAIESIQDITERKKTEIMLKTSEEKYRAFFESDPDYAILIDLNGEIIDVNQAAMQMSGLTKGELVGKNFSELDIFAEDELYIHQKMFDKGIRCEKIVPYESRIISKDGSVRWVLNASTTLKQHEKISYVLVIGSDITERKNTEFELKSSLNEKEVLLREIHHRVKNNLQIISSLLDLQKIYVKEDPLAINVLKDSQNRVLSMAMIHEMLYQTKDISYINFNDYIKNLVSNLLDSYRNNTIFINTVIDVQEILLNIETSIPLGLIISELLSNSLKYAFPHRKEGVIKLNLEANDIEYNLIISDNGVGLPEDIDYRNTESSLGFRLVNSLVTQLDGSIELDRSHGTQFTIKFKELHYKERI